MFALASSLESEPSMFGEELHKPEVSEMGSQTSLYAGSIWEVERDQKSSEIKAK